LVGGIAVGCAEVATACGLHAVTNKIKPTSMLKKRWVVFIFSPF
jgi:hypothetical protein